MKISVNLATRPFVELRPLFARLRIAIVTLLLLAVGLAFWLHTLTQKARAAEAQMNALKTKTLEYQQERQQNEARMRQPQNKAVLERSQFLNALFAQKSFSWTAVMMDLERVLPAGVQVTSIEPATTKSGDVTIRLKVSGDRDRAVQLIRNLEQSQRFVAPRLAGEAAQVQDAQHANASPTGPASGAVEFDILSGYNPLPPVPVKEAKDASAAKVDTNDAAGSDRPRTVSHQARGAKAAPRGQRTTPGGVR
jgi:type IV pilus assembly protein PilN